MILFEFSISGSSREHKGRRLQNRKNNMVHSVFVDSTCQQYADEKMLKRAPAEVSDMPLVLIGYSGNVSIVSSKYWL